MKDFLDELDNELNEISKTQKSFKSLKTNPERPPLKEKAVKNEKTKQNSFKPNNIKPNIKKPNSIKPKQNTQIVNQKTEIKSTTIKTDTHKNSKSKNNQNNVAGFLTRNTINFPETKFYLPSLREWYTRYIPIGWNNETWAKNMWMIQYNEDIVLIDCWVQFAESDMYWANYSIPDVSFLTKYKKQIKGFIITHAHLDHIWALKHILPALWMPPLYWTKLTLGLIRKSLEEFKLLDKAILIEVDASLEKKIKVWAFDIEFFKVNHSIPDSAWLYIKSPGWAKFLHTWDFKIDFTPAIDAPANLSRIKKMWDRWVTLLLSDSTGSARKGFCRSEKEVWIELEKIVSNHKKWRLLIAAFSSWISRVQQLIDICEKYDRHIFLSWRSMIENIAIAKKLWYLKVKQWVIKKMTPKTTEWIPAHKQIIITTWSQWEQYSALARMAEWKHNSIEIVSGDTIIFSSSVVPWNEKSVWGLMNKLVRLWANIVTKNDREVHTWWHAFQEEQKIMLKLVNPRYFMPIYGDLYFRHLHKNTALSIWFREEDVLMLDNWSIVDFAPDWSVFKSKIKVPIQNFIIDWHGMWTVTSHVLKAREKMMNSWVLVIMFKVDKKTKTILWYLKLETRWLVYLDEVRYVHRIIIKKARDVYENTIKDIPDIEEKDLLKIIKTDLESFLLKRIDREPMIIPIINEV